MTDFLINYWTYLVGWTIGILGLVWRYKSWDEKRKDREREEEARLADIEKRLHHLDNPDDGRVNKISKLCENQIDTNKKAYALGMYVKGRLDEINKDLS